MKMLTVTTCCQLNKAALVMNLKTENASLLGSKHSLRATSVPVVTTNLCPRCSRNSRHQRWRLSKCEQTAVARPPRSSEKSSSYLNRVRRRVIWRRPTPLVTRGIYMSMCIKCIESITKNTETCGGSSPSFSVTKNVLLVFLYDLIL